MQFERNDSTPVLNARVDLDAADRFRRIAVSGRFEPSRQFLLDNRSHAGKPGYEVLTPFVLDDGQRILVNRGWVPFRGYRDQLPDVSMTGIAFDDGERTTRRTADVRARERPRATGRRRSVAEGHAFPDARGTRVSARRETGAPQSCCLIRKRPKATSVSGRRPACHRRDTSLMQSSGGVLRVCCSCSTSASIFARCPDARFPRAAAGALC